ncbi:hypothetical protein BOX37_00805 [Nocardia mangyaensis]|uniref:DUF3558 domain-containing protein n=2 Tax=Nocardia mangyaensis TaxID=2213200 RepID=A0A1J0VL63_9NOCA|nr:hypothetical protein BOX37_00805 [Nocardia mangyaensis]
MRTAVGAVVVAAVVSGCGGGESGSAQPTTTTRDLEKIIVFNVCSELGDDALLEAGLDPATKRVLTDPPTGVSTWRVCNWKSLDNRYGVGSQRVDVFSTSHTLAETRVKESVTDLRDTTVGNRPGLIFREKNDPEACYVAFEAEQGMFEVAATWLSDEDNRTGDQCDLAAQYAAALEPNLPK